MQRKVLGIAARGRGLGTSETSNEAAAQQLCLNITAERIDLRSLWMSCCRVCKLVEQQLFGMSSTASMRYGLVCKHSNSATWYASVDVGCRPARADQSQGPRRGKTLDVPVVLGCGRQGWPVPTYQTIWKQSRSCWTLKSLISPSCRCKSQ